MKLATDIQYSISMGIAFEVRG